MKNPNEFTVIQLKEKLKKLGLSNIGNKPELIARLDEYDPSGSWRAEELPPGQETETAEESSDSNDPLLHRELELMRRERDLLERELQFSRRENELLRSTPSSNTSSSSTRTRPDIKSIGELLNEFNGDGQSFETWKKQFELLRASYELDDHSARILIGSKLRAKAANWFHSKPTHLEMNITQLLYEMTRVFDHRPNLLERRRQFEERKWKAEEAFGDYYHEKLILANRVPISEEEMVDYIIEGIPDMTLRNQASIQGFSSATSLLEAFKKVSLKRGTEGTVKKEVQVNSRINIKASARTPGKRDVSEERCYNCNRTGHRAKDCRQQKRERGSCYHCGEQGHIVRDCPKKKQIGYLSEEIGEEDEFHRNIAYTVKNNLDTYELRLNTLLDTGSPVSFIKRLFIRNNFMQPAEELRNRYKGINNSKFQILGIVKCQINLDGNNHNDVTICVVPDDTMSSPVVLGRDIMKIFGLTLTKPENNRDGIEQEIKDIMNIEINSVTENSSCLLNINSAISGEDRLRLIEIYENAYIKAKRPDLPKVDAELKLVVKEKQPFHFSPRRLAYTEKDKLHDILSDLLERKIIRPSNSEYASPIVLVRKKNNEIRMCVDYRALNKLLLRDNYPLPVIEDQLNVLSEKKYFTILDLKDGFHHIRVAEESIKYTAFVTPLGQYEYLKMPFGLKTAPSRFQRYINDAFADLISSGDVVVYIDDVLIATRTMQHHLQVLKRVFEVLVNRNMELRLDKCKFLCTEIEFLGYVVTETGIRPTKSGIEAVENFPIPQNVRDVQRYVGLCSYFRKFIEGFAFIAKPLYDLLKKDVPFNFGKEELESFDKLKSKLIASPILSIYDPKCETELHCDASAIGYGAILMQRKEDKKFHPIFYFSKRTTETEAKYHSFELETLAIIYALRRFRVYLHGLKFKIVTDCNSLSMTLSKKEVSPRIWRWALELQNYDYEVEHRNGNRMLHVDALSRSINVMVVDDNPLEFNLMVCQSKDSNILAIREKLETKEDSFFEMRNGLVYRKAGDNLLFYVPQSMEKNVIFKYHDEFGHLGIDKTVSTIMQSYWFPKLREKVNTHIRNCLKCISYSPTSGKTEGFLNIIPKGDVPFHTIHIDHFGPVDKQCLIKRYVFLVVDAFSKYVKLYATKTTSTKEVVSCLTSYFSYYSKPSVVISDRGSSFTSNDFEEFMKSNNIKHIKIATASPQANGQVERVNRVLAPMLAKLTEDKPEKRWYKTLEDVEFALNNSVSKASGMTPCKLLFGVNQRGKVIDEVCEYLNENVNTESRQLEKFRNNAAEKMLRSQQYNKNYYDRKRKEPHKYQKDDLVMIRNFEVTPGVSKKLLPQFKGPYRIVKELRNDRYVIADIDGFQHTQRPYQGVWAPANMRPWRLSDTA